MPTSSRFTSLVDDAFRSQPDLVWVGQGRAWFGWEEDNRFDPGVGSDRYHRGLEFLQDSGRPFAFASFTFDPDQDGSVVVVPAVTLEVRDEAARLSGEMPVTSGALTPVPTIRETLEDTAAWLDHVGRAMASISSGELDKVVLSRVVDLTFASTIPATTVAARLARVQDGSHTFMIDGLIGSSPELLASLENGTVRSISLAGSAPNRSDATQRLGSEKMMLEHDLAADSVEQGLAPNCTSLQRQPRVTATFAEIVHLATSFIGTVREGTSIMDLVSSLHPTAAVAGDPTKTAVELIRELEHYQRGRYAGPVGWFDRSGDGEFAIALRCGQLLGASSLRLYTGAGLVAGSDPETELEETRLKLKTMLSALAS